ncbi:MAG: histidine--tRNA ligase [Desulfobacteraceae bacterium]
MIQTIRGFRDILPEEIEVWQRIEQEAKNIFENFGFKEIRLPILEKTEVFARGIGENTDIVEKEMFTFPDSKGKNQTMRPEATASIVRSYIQHKMYAREPEQKLYTIGPMFRRERPQKGRYRQFYQINAEVLGIDSPLLDAQILVMLNRLFKNLDVKNLLTKINSLGCAVCRKKYNEILSAFIEKSEGLCEDCERRKTKNPLRILDCKVESCRKQLQGAPLLKDYLCDECRTHFEQLKQCLELEKIDYETDDYLVRGLDYYTKTAFEIQTKELGAQSAVAGGGRYDGLVEILGGPKTPGIGFAIGFDRLAEIVASKQEELKNGPFVYFLTFGENSEKKGFSLCNSLVSEGIRAEMDFSDKSMKAAMKKANKSNCRFCAIIGENEVEKGIISLKNMEEGTQEEVQEKDFISIIKKYI